MLCLSIFDYRAAYLGESEQANLQLQQGFQAVPEKRGNKVLLGSHELSVENTTHICLPIMYQSVLVQAKFNQRW